MLTKDLKSIYRQYLPRYQSEVKTYKPQKLWQLIQKAAKEAKANYKKLDKPKTCLLEAYINIWVRQTITNDLASRTIKKISIDNPPPSHKASVEYFLLLPHEMHGTLRKKLFNAKPEKRKAVWESFDLPIKEIEKRFIDMTKERNSFAKKKGYTNRIDMSLNQYKIPKSDYKIFIEKIDKLIDFCNDQLPKDTNLPEWFYSKFNLPCFLCRVSSFPFKTQDEVLDYVAKKYEILDKFKHKIDIKLGKSSKMSYKKETDSFEITIAKRVNTRHQLIDLIHELAHVIDYLQIFKKGVNTYKEGVYEREKEATKIEYALLKKISPEIYKAKFGDALLNFLGGLFQSELHFNPDQNLSKLYATIFNKCFKKAKQKTNSLYILDKHIVLTPLSTLPHTVAQAELLQKEIAKQP